MSDPKITELMQQLHGALENATTLGEKDREMLRQLSLEIQGLLANPGSAGDRGQGSTLDRLQDSLVRFEVTHPELTAALASVSKALGDMGI